MLSSFVQTEDYRARDIERNNSYLIQFAPKNLKQLLGVIISKALEKLTVFCSANFY